MRKMTKRLISLSVAGLMVLSLGACGEKKEVSTDATKQATTVETTQTATVAKVKEPVTLKIYGADLTRVSMNGPQSDLVAKEIERVTGVTMDIVDPKPDDQKLAAMFASNDLADIMVVGKGKWTENGIKGKLILPLDDLLKTNGPDIQKNADKAVAYSKEFISDDSKALYFIPRSIDNADPYPAIAPWIRWDYYAEAGYPAVNSYDDLLNVLSQIQKKHPTNAQNKKVYGFSLWNDWGIWCYNTFTGQMSGNMMDGLMNLHLDDYYKVSDVINSEDSAIWQGAKLFYKANKMGLLDPDSLTQKYDAAMQKFNENRTLLSICSWLPDVPNGQFAKDGQPDKGYAPLPPFQGTKVVNAGGNNPIGNIFLMYAISADCKTPDRAMDLLNYFYSFEGSRTLLSGIKGSQIEEVNGKLVPKADFLKAKTEDPNFAENTGFQKYFNLTGLGSSIKDDNGQVLALFNEPDIKYQAYPQVIKDWATHYGFKTLNEPWAKVPVNSTDSRFLSTRPVLPDDLTRISDKINNYITANLPRVVLAKNDAEYDAARNKMIADINKMDLKKIVDWQAVEVPKAKEREAFLFK